MKRHNKCAILSITGLLLAGLMLFGSCKDEEGDCTDCSTEVTDLNVELKDCELRKITDGDYAGWYCFYKLENNSVNARTYFVCNQDKAEKVLGNKDSVKVNVKFNRRELSTPIDMIATVIDVAEAEIISIEEVK